MLLCTIKLNKHFKAGYLQFTFKNKLETIVSHFILKFKALQHIILFLHLFNFRNKLKKNYKNNFILNKTTDIFL